MAASFRCNAKAYYNEKDRKAAAWLRELIKAGHIAPGEVDERSIEDVRPGDLAGYTQCHFFAGIGVWSYALRLAGWSDDRRVWTGSCPCQPFSQAGQGNGFGDERHLWPAWYSLIVQCRPPVILGEQVASKDGLGWLDLVHADLEGAGYACGAVDLCAAGVGAPHIRQRLWFVGVADAASGGRREFRGALEQGHVRHADGGGVADGLADPNDAGCGVGGPARLHDHGQPGHDDARCGTAGGLGDTQRTGREGGLDEDLPGAGRRGEGRVVEQPSGVAMRFAADDGRASHWSVTEWIWCRDEKYRPVEPSFKPMVDGSTRSLGPVRDEVAFALEVEVTAHACAANTDPREALRDVWKALQESAFRVWSFGRPECVSEAPVLLAFLLQLEAQGWALAQGVSRPGPQAREAGVRVLRGDEVQARSPRGRGLDEQRPEEPADLVRVLSSVLARHASACWGEAFAAHAVSTFPLAHGSTNRMLRLRGYGNAINASAAQAFIESTGLI